MVIKKNKTKKQQQSVFIIYIYISIDFIKNKECRHSKPGPVYTSNGQLNLMQGLARKKIVIGVTQGFLHMPRHEDYPRCEVGFPDS